MNRQVSALRFNRAYYDVFEKGLTLGLMTPAPMPTELPANPVEARRIAQIAEAAGFAALWTRDVPLMIPQEGSVYALDDPFVWLTMLASATTGIALGTAAAVLPLRNPLLLAKVALSLDRVSAGRFILGLGSGDRPEEFAAFGADVIAASEDYREKWSVVRAALAPPGEERSLLLQSTGGFEVLPAIDRRVPMITVGSSRQSLQWIAENADGWASYHREEGRQQGRIGLWDQALTQRNDGVKKPFIQSLNLDLVADESALNVPIPLGVKTVRLALIGYLNRLRDFGVEHVIVNLVQSSRSVEDVLVELGQFAIPNLSLVAIR